MHYDGRETPAGAVQQLFKALSAEMQEHKPLAGLRSLFQSAAQSQRDEDDCVSPCPEMELSPR
ncbi:MAG: hypothetical protein IPO91_06815 [Chloroflexi bacterium]|nr:hypothetical protein [Chloroflexota bacterium]